MSRRSLRKKHAAAPLASAAEGAALRLGSLRKEYPGKVVAVDGLSLEVNAGEFVSILGASGSGKTTTLRMISGFEEPTSGEVRLGDTLLNDVPAHKRPVNTVFQDYALFPHLDVRGNVEFGLRARSVGGDELRRQTDEVLEMVQLGHLADRPPGQLSGGQRQRVALARALVLRPKVLLLDEPLGALDLKLRRQMQVVLVELCRDLGITFVYVTHDQEEALAMSNRIAVMREGRLEQYGTPEQLYHEPATLIVADFIGDNNLLDGRLVGREGDRAIIDVEGLHMVADGRRLNGAVNGSKVVMCLRPEQLQLSGSPGDGGIPARVVQAIFSGASWRVVLRTASETEVSIVLRGERARLLEPGQEVYLQADNESAWAFNAPDAP